MKKILIAGAVGFIGSCVAKRFVEKGFQAAGVDDLFSGKKENIPKGLEFIEWYLW